MAPVVLSLLVIITLPVYVRTSSECFIPSGPNVTAPRPRVLGQLLPPGPPGVPCATMQLWKCDNSSCLYGFESNPMACSCKCFNPCDKKNCNKSQECVVMPAPDNLFYGMCVEKPVTCPKVFCNTPGCREGYKVDSRGCPTCDCKDPCENFGCPLGYNCQLLASSNGTSEPFCVGCPKLNCHKSGICPNGLAKDLSGCDICKCQGCPCYDDICDGLICTDNYMMDDVTGCDFCACETSSCSGKCSVGEKCSKKHTAHGRPYGLCTLTVACSQNCSSKETSCRYGLKLDYNVCHLPGCPCIDPCERIGCRAGQVCLMSLDDCQLMDGCRDAPMPYCHDCPSLANCSLLWTDCPGGLDKDQDGCDTCSCSRCSTGCDFYCRHGSATEDSTGCKDCDCKFDPCKDATCKANETCRAISTVDGVLLAQCVPVTPAGATTTTSSTTTTPPATTTTSSSSSSSSASTTTTRGRGQQCPTVVCDPRCTRPIDPTSGCNFCNCTGVDPCQGYSCPESSICSVDRSSCDGGDGCVGSAICTVRPPLPTSTTTTKTTTTGPSIVCSPPVCLDPSCRLVSKPGEPCPVCECPGLCQNIKCPIGQTCWLMTLPGCSPPCQETPVCIPSPPVDSTTTTSPATTTTPTTTTTTSPTTTRSPPVFCQIPTCSDPSCRISSKPGVQCPVCECLEDCQNVVCPANQICQMLTPTNCVQCSKIAKCVPSRPSFCLEAADGGDLCLDSPILQFHFNSTAQTCQSFWFNGCGGNKNRFSSAPSCQSICRLETTDDACPTFSCSKDCRHGFKLDANGCKKCECINICEGFACSSSNQECRIRATPCPAGDSVPHCSSTEFAECVCRPTACLVTCPLGKVEDAQGCKTCECNDPCKSERCPNGQLCQVVEHQNCNRNFSCSSTFSGKCLDAFLKKNIRWRINASYEVYVLGNVDSLVREVKGQLSNQFRVKRDFVSISKLEKGSIVTTADILYTSSNDYSSVDDPDNFTITLDEVPYSAEILFSSYEVPAQETLHPSRSFLTSAEIVLIVLLCVLVPLAIAVSVLVTYFVCMRCKGRRGMLPILSSSSVSSESLKEVPMHEDTVKSGYSTLTITTTVDSQKARPKSFTLA